MGDKGENQELYTSSFSRPICLETTVVPTRSPTLLARVAKGSMVGAVRSSDVADRVLHLADLHPAVQQSGTHIQQIVRQLRLGFKG